MLETRLQIDASLTQRYIFTLLALSAGISFVVSAPIGFLADKTGSKKTWLVAALFLALVSTFSIAFATTSKAPPPFFFFFPSLSFLFHACCTDRSHRISSFYGSCPASSRQLHYLGTWLLDHCGQCAVGTSGEKLWHRIYGRKRRDLGWPGTGWNAPRIGWLLGGLVLCI